MDIKEYEEQVHRIKLGKNLLTESAFQKLIIKHLVNDNGYQFRKSSSYDPVYAMDVDLLFAFFERTQANQMKRLHALYNGGSRATILAKIKNAIASRGLVDCIWHGVQFDAGVAQPRLSSSICRLRP